MWFIYIVILVVLWLIEVFYLKWAFLKGIKDDPNHRSAHVKPTIRGGGVIFIPAVLLFLICFPQEFFTYSYLLIAILLVGIISFIDDLKTLSPKIRMLVHVIAFTIIFFELGLLYKVSLVYTFGLLLLVYIFTIGYLNIYNFMDGINGMTFLNALISYVSFYVVNNYVVEFTSSELLLIFIMTTLIFGFFNFRKKPVCFAGDVGSITMGFTVIYFIIKLFLTTNNYGVFLMLSVYIIDGGWTIIERLIRKENIFEAHKRHLYQLYANEIKIPHLNISIYYFITQLILNMVAAYFLLNDIDNSILAGLLILVGLSFIYILLKTRVYKRIRLET